MAMEKTEMKPYNNYLGEIIMKKLLSVIISLSLIMSACTISANANDEISITIDGKPKIFDVMPVMEEDRVLVPMRGIFEALGATISWDDETMTVTGAKNDISVSLQIENNIAKVNDREILLATPAKLVSGRTMVPVKFVSDALGYNASWHEETNTVAITSNENAVNILDGKKVIFIGNSFTYRGLCVLQKKLDELTQEERSNDEGYFYQLCRENGADVSVTNWTFGSHALHNMFKNDCTVKGECNGVNHESYLKDRYFDYVFIQPGRGTTSSENLISDIEYIIATFREANPNVKFIFLGCAAYYGVNQNDTVYQEILDKYDEVEALGIEIADWGKLVNDLINGTAKVSNSEFEYNKNTFIVKDAYHQNMLTGYITTLYAYCTITGEKAVGQPYDFYNDKELNIKFDIPDYVSYYYKNGTEDTSADEIMESPYDMMEIQKLVDEYMNK